MKRLAVLSSVVVSLAGAGQRHGRQPPAGCRHAAPLWVEFGDTSVTFATSSSVGPGLVLASAGLAGPSELRALGAQTVYWYMKLQASSARRRAGRPGDDPAAREALFQRAVASSGCETPVIALNELFGVYRPTPWSTRRTCTARTCSTC